MLRSDRYDRCTNHHGSHCSLPRYYVHDDSATVESPALPGMAGQLYISGKGVALGYIGAPELTKERFLHSSLAEQVTYRTGDLVRFMPEDPWGDLVTWSSSELRTSLVLEFLGRADFQVKVRGHRIELQEIEEAARQVQVPSHSSPLRAVVVMVINQKLVAFVTPQVVDVMHLAEALRNVLPKYMVPDLISAREQMPLTPSGNVDRKALDTSVDWRRPEREIHEILDPQSDMEKIVHDAYQTVLGLEKLSVDDDFFELLDQIWDFAPGSSFLWSMLVNVTMFFSTLSMIIYEMFINVIDSSIFHGYPLVI